jgi:hypothetical protein
MMLSAGEESLVNARILTNSKLIRIWKTLFVPVRVISWIILKRMKTIH